MSRYSTTHRCAVSGCREVRYVADSTRAEQRETYARQVRDPWKCTRHSHPEQVLSRDRQEITAEAVAGPSRRFPDLPGLFWDGPASALSSGYAFGPGFMAWADDFPEGTRLIVTARVVLPEEPARDSRAQANGDHRD